MHVRVHCRGIVIVTPPPDVAIILISGTGEARNGAPAVGIIKAIVARFSASGHESLAVFPNVPLELTTCHGERVGARRG
jgi:hypothetical protein